jgi:hypothetical protein
MEEGAMSVSNSQGIEQLLHAENELLPPKSLVENALLKDYPRGIPALCG